eukprot:6479722-Amphidinium_carterae.1
MSLLVSAFGRKKSAWLRRLEMRQVISPQIASIVLVRVDPSNHSAERIPLAKKPARGSTKTIVPLRTKKNT